MEVIEIPGYIEDEKLQIAKRYLLKRQLDDDRAQARANARFTDAALRAIIRDYTREAGVRSLERQIGAVCRHAAMRIAEGTAERLSIEREATLAGDSRGDPVSSARSRCARACPA